MQAHANEMQPYLLLFILAFFAAWMAVICFLISFLTGWHTLAKRFRTQAEPYGETRVVGPLFSTVYLRYWTHYSSCVRLTAAEDALYLSVIFLFRAGHPPLCIPWNEIQFGCDKFLWQRYVVLTLGNEEKIPMRISERMAGKLGILERPPNSTPYAGRA